MLCQSKLGLAASMIVSSGTGPEKWRALLCPWRERLCPSVSRAFVFERTPCNMPGYTKLQKTSIPHEDGKTNVSRMDLWLQGSAQ